MEIKLIKDTHNPYETDTRAWHAVIDICQACDLGQETTIERLNKMHDTESDYYNDVLPQLELDGYIQLIK